MKKVLSILTIFAFVANNANAQCSVYSNGNVESATSSISASTLSVRDNTGYDVSVNGTSQGLYAMSKDHFISRLWPRRPRKKIAVPQNLIWNNRKCFLGYLTVRINNN